MTELDPIDPTVIGPGLVAVPLGPTVWDDLPDGQHAVAPDGTVYQRRGGLWFRDPWWQGSDGEEVVAICDNPDGWAYDNGWPRAYIEAAEGGLTPIVLPGRSGD